MASSDKNARSPSAIDEIGELLGFGPALTATGASSAGIRFRWEDVGKQYQAGTRLRQRRRLVPTDEGDPESFSIEDLSRQINFRRDVCQTARELALDVEREQDAPDGSASWAAGEVLATAGLLASRMAALRSAWEQDGADWSTVGEIANAILTLAFDLGAEYQVLQMKLPLGDSGKSLESLGDMGFRVIQGPRGRTPEWWHTFLPIARGYCSGKTHVTYGELVRLARASDLRPANPPATDKALTDGMKKMVERGLLDIPRAAKGIVLASLPE